MNRRRFIQLAALPLFFPQNLSAARSHGGPPARSDYYFFDDRFELARQLAAATVDGCEPTAVQSDITGIWGAGLGRVCARGPLAMRGVTTESFYFCLRVMLSDHALVTAESTRFGRDLHGWIIQSHPHPSRGLMT